MAPFLGAQFATIPYDLFLYKELDNVFGRSGSCKRLPSVNLCKAIASVSNSLHNNLFGHRPIQWLSNPSCLENELRDLFYGMMSYILPPDTFFTLMITILVSRSNRRRENPTRVLVSINSQYE